jgi:hypothetical protein
MSAVSDELRLLDREPGRFAFFAWKNFTIVVWHELPEVSEVERLVRMGERRVRENPGKLSDVHLIARKIGLPGAAARSALTQASRSGSPHLAAVGVWLAGSGFWASALRSFVTSLSVLLRGPFELRIFGDLDELAAWLPPIHESRTGVAVGQAQLLEVLRRAVARAEDQEPSSVAAAAS